MSSKFIPNSFQVPNALVDLLMAGLSGNAIKCYLLVARQTTGWHKEMDYIPIAQFKAKCGIKKDETVTEATTQLLQFGLIEKVEQRGRVTGYKLNFVIDDNSVAPPKMGGTTTPDKRGTSKYTTKNTNTKNKESNAHECATPAPEQIADKQPEKQKTKKTDLWAQGLAMLIAEGVDEAVAKDHIAIRKTKRQPLTETALAGLQREAAKAGLTLAQAVQYATEQGWAGFKAQWLHNAQQGFNGAPNGFVPTVRKVEQVTQGGLRDMRTGELIPAPEVDTTEINF